MQLSDFQFELPPELIAQHPVAERHASRLLSLDGQSGAITDGHFIDLPLQLSTADLLVFNNTKVLPARLLGKKDSGGQVEVLVERVLDEHRVLAHLRCSKVPKPGTYLHLEAKLAVEVMARHDALFELYFHTDNTVVEALHHYGRVPLPPYIKRELDKKDWDRYQTVYAERIGAVAAPTAGLHFDLAMLEKLTELGIDTAQITLHIGAGTFQPVRVADIKQHKMHYERIEVSEQVCQQVAAARARGGRVIAVGTTCVRALESASQSGQLAPFSGETDIFIYPGYQFRSVDALITNFHLSGSTLLMLVAALAGRNNIMQAYQHAIEQQYRFFSYGDAMFITRKAL